MPTPSVKPPKQTWIATMGKVEFDGKELAYIPLAPSTDAPTGNQPVVAVAKSNLFFEDGAVSFEANLSDPLGSCQLILNVDTPSWLLLGFNTSGFPYGIQRWSSNVFERLAVAGTAGDLPVDRWIPVVVRVSGSSVSLEVDGVPLCNANFEVSRGPLAFLFQGQKTIRVRNVRRAAVSPRAFVVMQFVKEFNELFDEVIKPTCESFGFETIRADNIYTNGQIIADITAQLREASVIVADVTPDNPNVYYEVGFAHALGKPTILLCDRRREKLPFDLSGFRTIFYENSIGGKSAVEERLRKHLEGIVRPATGPSIRGLTSR